MKNFLLRLKKHSSRGDTLVEVLISIAIITLVVAIGYSVANRSLQNGTSASQRNQALSLAQGQVEQLVNAVNSNSIDQYKQTSAFCIDPSKPTQTPPPAATSATCTDFKYGSNDTPYKMVVTYDSESGIFTVKATWAQSTGNKTAAGNEGQLTLYYKAPGLFVGKDACPNIDGIQEVVPNGLHFKDGKCLKPDGSEPSPGEIVTTTTGPPKCAIHSVVANPGNPPGLNADCENGHCGSPTYPGGCDNIKVVCLPPPPAVGCACTVTITDYNYQGTGSAAANYWNCGGSPPPNTVYPAPANGALFNPAANACPPPTYGTATDVANGNCGAAPFCTDLTNSAGGPMYGTYPHCYSAPTINSGTGVTTWPPCNDLNDPDPNNPNCTNPGAPPGGGTTTCDPATTDCGGTGTGCDPATPGCADPSGQCGSGYYWNGATCVSQGGGGGCGLCGCGLNDASPWMPNFGIMNLFNPVRFAAWC